MKSILKFLSGAALLVAASAFAADDVGLINHMIGDVSYTSGSAASKAKAYMKVREGDKFTLPSGSQLRVVYFQGGRQETFTGPAAFTAGKNESSIQSGDRPQVSTLPAGVPQKIAQTPELVAIAKLGRSGGVAVRGVGTEKRLTPQQQAEVRQARQTYDQLRQSAAADDITPELYLYSVLQDHLLYTDMKPIVESMQKRQPKDPDVAAMAEYVKVKTETK
jgi:hypothetical protein